jgi:hypothetical protein
MNRRAVLTELGADLEALRRRDRNAILFDLGLDCLQVDACIRTADPVLIAKLRTEAGRPLFDRENAAMAAILAASPHRVFISRLGRIEVFQAIPPSGGTSPFGPHTHVLPKLLGRRRTHAATEPIPEGWVPCAHLYPPHPAEDALGRPRAFDPAWHIAFQEILMMFGDPDFVGLKQRVMAAVAAGEEPLACGLSQSRLARASIRVALRQLQSSGGNLPKLPLWLATYGDRDGAIS